MTEIMFVNATGRNVGVEMDPTTALFEVALGGRVHKKDTSGFSLWFSLDEEKQGDRPNLAASLFYYRWTGDVKFFYGCVALTGPAPYGDPHQVEEKYFLSMKDYCRDHRRTVY